MMMTRPPVIWTLLLSLAALLAICQTGCGRRSNAYRGDFVDPGALDSRETVDEEISALRDSLRMENGTRRVELHRRLAVAYRIVGTPESRIRSIEEIEIALRLAPEDPLLHVEKGLTRCAQRFIGDAVACLEKAIEIDPGCFEAWYHLGRIRRDDYLKDMCFPEVLREATAFFRRANAIDGTHEDALFNLSFLSFLDGLSADAARYCSTGERLHPRSPRFPLLAATALLQSDRFEEAAVRFETALSLMDERERAVFEDIGPLLPREEGEYYGHLDDANRAEYNRKFWARNDPTPATPLNERLLEHYRRVFLAEELLAVPRMDLEGTCTARGTTLVRYGVPTAIDYNLGQGVDGPFVIWSYVTEDRLFRLYFQDEFLNGNYHIPIDPKFSMLADITEGILQMVPQMYRYPLPFGTLPAALQWAQTSGPGETTRMEFSLALPVAAVSAGDGRCALDLTFFDADWNRFLTESFAFDADSLREIERSGSAWLVATFERDLVPRELECTLALEIRGGLPPSRAVLTEPVLMRGFHGRSLVMSSVRITLSDPGGSCTSILDPMPMFERGSPACISYELFNLRRDNTMRARYRISYSIRAAGPLTEPQGFRRALAYIVASVTGGNDGEPFITNSFERGTGDSYVYDRLQIDTGALGEGRYLIVLEAEDLISRTVVSEQREFTVLESGR